MKCRRDIFGSRRNEMFKGLVFPILLHMSRFDSGEKNRRQDFDQTSRTIRGVLRLGLQGVDKSG